MVISTLLSFLYPPPPSLFITAMSVISVTFLGNAGLKEIKGTHMQYSKFWNSSNEKKDKARISSRNGMLVLYTPAFLGGLASLAIFPDEDLRFVLICSALTLHFLKRVLEVLFVHKYSGWMDVEAAIPISMSYFISTVSMIYAQHLTLGSSEPSIDLKYIGIVIYLVGLIGNFYHHCLLSKLRSSKNEKEYKIPQGGLFNLVICPHYLFEILVFVGASCISQTLYSLSFALGTMFYLMGRSVATRRWYQSKFDDFPEDVKALVPYIF